MNESELVWVCNSEFGGRGQPVIVEPSFVFTFIITARASELERGCLILFQDLCDNSFPPHSGLLVGVRRP
eukprot:3284968-Rhodomonas_salina.1